MKYLAIHITPDGVEHFHIVTLPEFEEKGRYVQWKSAVHFAGRELSRKFPCTDDGRLDTIKSNACKEWTDFERLIADVGPPAYILEDAIKDGKPIHYHKSLWEFYTAIGYDYKSKKYVDNTRTLY